MQFLLFSYFSNFLHSRFNTSASNVLIASIFKLSLIAYTTNNAINQTNTTNNVINQPNTTNNAINQPNNTINQPNDTINQPNTTNNAIDQTKLLLLMNLLQLLI